MIIESKTGRLYTDCQRMNAVYLTEERKVLKKTYRVVTEYTDYNGDKVQQEIRTADKAEAEKIYDEIVSSVKGQVINQ